MCLGTRLNKEKVGNLLVKITSDLGVVYHTKLLKLLFIIDETSIEKYGYPISWLDYKVWQLGPVPPVIYQDIRFDGHEYLEYINPVKDELGTRIVAVKEFDDIDFSEAELNLIDAVLKEFGRMSSDDLVQITHEEGGLWKTIVDSKGGEEVLFEEVNTTPYSIDFKTKIEGDAEKTEIFNNALENLEFYASL
ncbi:Panacea domain-containing protein [Carboxylicivirga sp. RSCT41]|uniref:Panacea domain-containing protein n=1 Tax=Carboxylicivirga agarovorans TaxID=3417570 RepID=UPI003D33A4CD